MPSMRIPLAASRDNRYRFPDPLFQMLPDNLRQLSEYAGEYYRVVPTESSVDLSVRKMDFPPVRDYKHKPFWCEAKDYVYSNCDPLLRANTVFASSEEVFSRINLDSASGAVWSSLGFKRKREFFSSRSCVEHLFSDPLDWGPILWRVSGKTEWYGSVDLDNNKVRTFIIPPVDLLWWQQICYLHQNEAMKSFWWSEYGFNPYSGGTNRLAHSLLKRGKTIVSYDVKGWDRRLPIMRTIYKMRNVYSTDPALYEWVARNTISSLLLLPDGTIVLKEIGNNSGSGCTTNDNIFGHMFIIAYGLLCLYGGDVSRLDLCSVHIYGDDCILSTPDSFTYSEVEVVLSSSFGEFGLQLDPLIVTEGLAGHTFLGFEFGLVNGFYIPRYNQSRLVASFCYTIDKKNPLPALISKAWTLCVMAAGGDYEVFELMRSCVDFYLTSLRSEKDPTVRAYCSLGAPEYSDCINFFLGLESSVGGIIMSSFTNGKSDSIRAIARQDC